MFFCDACADKNGWPKSGFRSHGRCESCGEGAVCNDIPSAALPLPPEQQVHKLPCSICGMITEFACSDCRIDLKKSIHVCTKRSCQEQHETLYCTRKPVGHDAYREPQPWDLVGWNQSDVGPGGSVHVRCVLDALSGWVTYVDVKGKTGEPVKLRKGLSSLQAWRQWCHKNKPRVIRLASHG